MASKDAAVKGGKLLAELRARCPKNQVHKLEKFLADRMHAEIRVNSLRVEQPLIDWDFYRRHVRKEYVELITDYEKQYTSLKIPYPVDNYTHLIDEAKEELQCEVEEYIEQSDERICEYQKEYDRIKGLLPFNAMTWEDYCHIYPDDAPDFLNKPTFWPHDEEEQMKPPQPTPPPPPPAPTPTPAATAKPTPPAAAAAAKPAPKEKPAAAPAAAAKPAPKEKPAAAPAATAKPAPAPAAAAKPTTTAATAKPKEKDEDKSKGEKK